VTAAHPLDLVWAALTAAEQRMHASAEARAYYRQPCREWHNTPRNQQRDADEEATKWPT